MLLVSQIYQPFSLVLVFKLLLFFLVIIIMAIGMYLREMLPLKQKMKVFSLIRKEEIHILRLLRSTLAMRLQRRKIKFVLVLLSHCKL